MLNTLSTRPASLAALDLNLLVVFDAVFAERHISRAARRLGKSQPAVSGALARLRSLLDDPLFVRDGAGVRPTRLAREMATPIREALQLLNEPLRRERDYAPATSARTFHLNLNDYTQTILLPRLLAHLKEHAPNVSSLPACPFHCRTHRFDRDSPETRSAGFRGPSAAEDVPPTAADGSIHSQGVLVRRRPPRSRKPVVASDNQRDLQPPMIDGLTKPCEASFWRLISEGRLCVP